MQEEMHETKQVRPSAERAFIWVGLVPILLGLMTLLALGRYREQTNWVSHTKEVLAELDQMMLIMTGAETSQRGFLLTDDPSYLRRYNEALGLVEAHLGALHSLTADNRTQQVAVEQLSSLVHVRIGKMNEVLELRRSHELPAQQAVEDMASGTVLMDRIRGISTNMIREENRLLQLRTDAQRNTGIQVAIVFVFGIVASVVLLFWAYRKILGYAEARDRAEAEIRELNLGLQRRVEERTAELERANVQLTRSNEDLTRFAYVASHDLQEPLRMIGSYAGLLGRRYEGQLDERADKYIFYIVDGAKRMQTLVQDLLAYSRSGSQALKFQPTNMEEVLSTAIGNLEFAIADASAVITRDPLPSLTADPVKITQVMQNLLANAIKFRKADEPPRIHVSARQEEKDWIFSVRDNGIGFEPRYSDRIFTIFQRLHPVGQYPGTGIGLAICKRIVEGHGGRVGADSEPGAGSTFYFVLPNAGPAAAAIQPNDAQTEETKEP